MLQLKFFGRRHEEIVGWDTNVLCELNVTKQVKPKKTKCSATFSNQTVWYLTLQTAPPWGLKQELCIESLSQTANFSVFLMSFGGCDSLKRLRLSETHTRTSDLLARKTVKTVEEEENISQLTKFFLRYRSLLRWRKRKRIQSSEFMLRGRVDSFEDLKIWNMKTAAVS